MASARSLVTPPYSWTIAWYQSVLACRQGCPTCFKSICKVFINCAMLSRRCEGPSTILLTLKKQAPTQLERLPHAIISRTRRAASFFHDSMDVRNVMFTSNRFHCILDLLAQPTLQLANRCLFDSQIVDCEAVCGGGSHDQTSIGSTGFNSN